MPRIDWPSVVGDTGNPIRVTVEDDIDLATDVASLTFSMVRRYSGGVKVYKAEAEIVNTETREIQYAGWTEDQVNEPGWYTADFELILTNGKPLTVPTSPLLVYFYPERT